MLISKKKFKPLERMARKLAVHPDNITFRHVSLIVRKRRIVAAGINRTKTHPKAAEYGYRYEALHSELDALKRVPQKHRNGMTLVNFRFNASGKLRMSKPCEKCLPWCTVMFDNIYYTNRDGLLVKHP